MIVGFDAHCGGPLRHERRIFSLPASVGTRLLHQFRISETARFQEPSVGTYIACLDSWARPCAGLGTPPMKCGRSAAGRPHHSSLDSYGSNSVRRAGSAHLKYLPLPRPPCQVYLTLACDPAAIG